MTCDKLRGTPMLDYIYGALSKRRAAAAEAHLRGCAACRKEARELRKLVAALDESEGDHKCVRVIELGADGVPADYSWWSNLNASDQARESTHWTINKDISVDYAMVQGEEATFDVLPCSDRQYLYKTRFPRPVGPGERDDALLVEHPTGSDGRAQALGDGRWRYHFGTTPNSSRHWVHVLAVRLPAGAKLVSAEPAPTKTKTNGTTTLVWHSLLEPIQQRPDGTWPWQFESTVEYELDKRTEHPGREEGLTDWARTHLRWAPRIAFEIADLNCFAEDAERAIHLLSRAEDLDASDSLSWYRLGLALWYSKHYDEALESFGRVYRVSDASAMWRFAARVWQGHIFDLLGRRDEALGAYQEVLSIDIGDGYMQHSLIDMTINRAWVEERLKTPFVRK